MAELIEKMSPALNAVRCWWLESSKWGRLSAVYSASFFLAWLKPHATATLPFRFLSLILGLPVILIYAPLRTLFQRVIGRPAIPGSPFLFETGARLVQGLFGWLPDGDIDFVPLAAFEMIGMSLIH